MACRFMPFLEYKWGICRLIYYYYSDTFFRRMNFCGNLGWITDKTSIIWVLLILSRKWINSGE